MVERQRERDTFLPQKGQHSSLGTALMLSIKKIQFRKFVYSEKPESETIKKIFQTLTGPSRTNGSH